MLKIIDADFSFEDARGTIVQLIHGGYSQVNVITSRKGVVRGGHYHKLNEEAFYVVSGLTEVTVNGQTRRFGAGSFFGIEPYDMHSFVYLEDTVLVSLYSRGVELEDGKKDIYTE